MNILKKLKIAAKVFAYNITGKTNDPIFIIGTGRCGSSLLVDVLATNKNIQIDQDELYYMFLLALKDDKGFIHEPMYSDLINFRLTAKKSLELWTPFYRKKLKIIIDDKINQNEKTYILKSPAITFILPEIKKMYPNAKYINLYRNGYAVARSWFKKEYFREKRYQTHFSEHEFLLACAKYYQESIDEISKFLEGIPVENQLSLSYEQFTEKPILETQKILDFVNIDAQCEFDFNTIQSMNFKIDKLSNNEQDELTSIMQESLKSLGYTA